MIYKFWMIYFLIITPILCLNNQTSTKITPIQFIDTITINHTYKIPFIIKIWVFLQILRLI
jgi:hypothetical protein